MKCPRCLKPNEEAKAKGHDAESFLKTAKCVICGTEDHVACQTSHCGLCFGVIAGLEHMLSYKAGRLFVKHVMENQDD